MARLSDLMAALESTRGSARRRLSDLLTNPGDVLRMLNAQAREDGDAKLDRVRRQLSALPETRAQAKEEWLDEMDARAGDLLGFGVTKVVGKAGAPAAGRAAERKVAARAEQGLQQNSGFTLDAAGRAPAGGYAVASDKGTKAQFSGSRPTLKEIADWLAQTRSDRGAPNRYAGGWVDPSVQPTLSELEVSSVFPQKNRALALGEMLNEKAVYDLGSFANVDVRYPKETSLTAAFRELVKSKDDAVRRAYEAGDKINRTHFADRPWWAANNTLLDEIYGPNLDMWLHNFGITAPQMSVPANITLANKATGRMLRGEPVVSETAKNFQSGSVNAALKNYQAGRYWDENRMLTSPKVAEMIHAPLYPDVGVYDTLRYANQLYGVPDLSRGQHYVINEQMRRLAGEAGERVGPFTAKVWQGITPDAPLVQQAPMVDAYADRAFRLIPKRSAKQNAEEFGPQFNRKLTDPDEIKDLLRRGLIWVTAPIGIGLASSKDDR